MGTKLASIMVVAMLVGAGQHSRAAPADGHYDASGDLVLGAVMSESGDVRLKDVASYVNEHIKPWLSDPLIVSTVLAQDAETKKLTQSRSKIIYRFCRAVGA